ncbi:hypothetical protein [Rhodobium gokarnense]|uniref:Uncharacterized protein n=1 Tax=Rhodobium gokarnense TaxID=364296 RepID=A0ABT3H5Y0_9HYPH|nr:hypothetical protein [Rhodobium gokarnense]MCW2305799.1 hypothetical protein [Rhodobium gokarnense]
MPSTTWRRRSGWLRAAVLAVLLSVSAVPVAGSVIAEASPQIAAETLQGPAALALAPSVVIGPVLNGTSGTAPGRIAAIPKSDRLPLTKPEQKIVTGLNAILFSAMLFVVLVMWRHLARSFNRDRRSTWEDWQ